MAQEIIPLERLPRQEFSIRLSNMRYVFRVIQVGDMMYVTVTRDDIVLIENVRAVAGRNLLPYDYMGPGNFAFVTKDDALPWYEDFGNTCLLIYDDSI